MFSEWLMHWLSSGDVSVDSAYGVKSFLCSVQHISLHLVVFFNFRLKRLDSKFCLCSTAMKGYKATWLQPCKQLCEAVLTHRDV